MALGFLGRLRIAEAAVGLVELKRLAVEGMGFIIEALEVREQEL